MLYIWIYADSIAIQDSASIKNDVKYIIMYA